MKWVLRSRVNGRVTKSSSCCSSGASLLELPVEVILDILSRLDVEDLLVCQMVSKRLNILTKEPQFIDLHLERANTQSCRILLYDVEKHDLYTWMYSGEQSRCKQIPSSLTTDSLSFNSSCNGLLCISQSMSTFICNPMTNASSRLPNSNFKPINTSTGQGLGFDSINKRYKVVRAYNMNGFEHGRVHNYTKGEIITMGETSWRRLDFPQRLRSCNDTVFINGAFHWLLNSLDGVLVLDIVTEEFRTVGFIQPAVLPPRNSELVIFGKALALVEVSNGRYQKFLDIWRMVRCGTDSGYSLHHSRFDVSVLDEEFNKNLTFGGAVGESHLLFDVLQPRGCSYFNRLTLLDSQGNTCSDSDVVGLPQSYFKTSLFVPSLVNPSAFWCELRACLLELPIEIVFDILSRLHVEDLLVCQMVSKRLNKLTKEPRFIDLHLERAKTQLRRILLHDIEKHGLYTWMYSEGQSRCKQIPSSLTTGIFSFDGSCNGLLCISQSMSTFIFNPMTKVSLRLPNSHFRPVNTSAGQGLGFDSINKRYKVVRAYNMNGLQHGTVYGYTKGEIITMGKSSWRPLDFPQKLKSCDDTVFINGAFHWLLNSLDGVLVLNIETEKFRTIKFIHPAVLPPRNSELVTFGEALALVEVSNNQKSLHIWRMVSSECNCGFRLLPSKFDISVLDNEFNKNLTFGGALGENYLLLDGLQLRGCSSFNRLTLFDSQRNKCSVSDDVGLPQTYFKTSLFFPSLVNPNTFWCEEK